MLLTSDQIRSLVERYPYLRPHNAWTGKVYDDYDFSYTYVDNLPCGWDRLFLLYCKCIRDYLIKNNYLDKFYFTQVKEKYGTMRLYNAGCPKDIQRITNLFEGYSKYVCQDCGDFSVFRTDGWVSHLCSICVLKYSNSYKKIKKSKHYTILTYENGNEVSINYTYKYLNREYKKVLGMTTEEFYQYLLDT